MSRATTVKTAEAVEHANRWLEQHRYVLPELRHVFCEYFRRHGRDFLWRRTNDPYKVLVAEVLLQKTASKPVETVWANFVEKYPNVETLAGAPIEEVQNTIRPLGLHKRAKALHETAKIVLDEGDGQIIADSKFLKSLPGVGRYTASAILSFAFDIEAATIDVNAARVYTRVAGFAPKTVRQGLAFADLIGRNVIRGQAHRAINLGVLDMASAVCRPEPRCNDCLAHRMCEFGQHYAKDQ